MAAYSYMALIPLIQPPIMKLLTTKKERKVKMDQTPRRSPRPRRSSSPSSVTIFVILLLPSTAPLIGMPDAGQPVPGDAACADRLSDTAQNALMNIVTILLGIVRGRQRTVGTSFLTPETLKIIVLGLVAFCHLHRRRPAAAAM